MMLLEVPLLYKIRNNGKPKTIAVIWCCYKEKFFAVLRELSRAIPDVII
jgi:hypothetical protein